MTWLARCMELCSRIHGYIAADNPSSYMYIYIDRQLNGRISILYDVMPYRWLRLYGIHFYWKDNGKPIRLGNKEVQCVSIKLNYNMFAFSLIFKFLFKLLLVQLLSLPRASAGLIIGFCFTCSSIYCLSRLPVLP